MTLDGDSEVLRSLGYAQSVKYLKGEWPLADAIAQCEIKTRNYAKRQMTWFRSDPDIKWINEFGSSDKAKSAALDIVRTFLGELETSNEKKAFVTNAKETFTSETT
jgi:tRNA dimethylallyltransferase